MFARRVHQHLMPTDLFVRRPLLWLTFAAQKRATILCSPNFGYRHYLKVLGERPVDGLDLSSRPAGLQWRRTDLRRSVRRVPRPAAPARLSRTAMYPVYGLAEASLAVTFPLPGRRCDGALNRHHLGVGAGGADAAAGSREPCELVSRGPSGPVLRRAHRRDDERDRCRRARSGTS